MGCNAALGGLVYDFVNSRGKSRLVKMVWGKGQSAENSVARIFLSLVLPQGLLLTMPEVRCVSCEVGHFLRRRPSMRGPEKKQGKKENNPFKSENWVLRAK